MKNVLRYIFLVLCTCFTLQAYAQGSIEVTGQVVDADQEGLPGANILIKGTTVGTTTDVEGNYKLTVTNPGQAVLVFSFIGLDSKEVAVKNQRRINVTLESSAVELEEVVKIGYATVKRKDLTGSVSSVKASELAAVPISDVTQALSGKVAGVQVIRSQGSPDADVSIKVRGGYIDYTKQEPLYIIDGFPSEDGLKGIEANDISQLTS